MVKGIGVYDRIRTDLSQNSPTVNSLKILFAKMKVCFKRNRFSNISVEGLHTMKEKRQFHGWTTIVSAEWSRILPLRVAQKYIWNFI